MNLSRSRHSFDLLKILRSPKYVWLHCNFFPCVAFSQEYSPGLPAVDEAVLAKVESRWKRVLGNVKHYGNAIFVLGPMGAGKTTTIESCFKTHGYFRHYAYVDTDAIMGSIDAFSADKVDQYYPLARKIAIRLTDWILEEKISFVAEGTCVKVRELIEYMERLKESGYKIHVNHLVSDPLHVLLCRSKHRKNRIISEEVVESIYKNTKLGLKELYEYNKQVNYTLFEDLDLAENLHKNCKADPLFAP